VVDGVEKMKLPSVKTIMTIPGVDRATALKVRDMLECYHYRDNVEAKVQELGCVNTLKWIDSCYNLPEDYTVIMSACDELLGTCGVESFETADGDYVDYCNTGDTYATTICYDGTTGRFMVASWGYLAEKYGSM
jgi:hypothetical protein